MITVPQEPPSSTSLFRNFNKVPPLTDFLLASWVCCTLERFHECFGRRPDSFLTARAPCPTSLCLSRPSLCSDCSGSLQMPSLCCDPCSGLSVASSAPIPRCFQGAVCSKQPKSLPHPDRLHPAAAAAGTGGSDRDRSGGGGSSSGEWFRSHPVGTALLILLLLVLVVALGVALAVQSAPQDPVTPEVLQCCPHGWVGYNGICYYFSRDDGTWEQGQESCSKLGASLAILMDEAMDLLFRLRGNGDFWLGLRRRGERLQWEDGSSYSSRVPVFGSADCVYLADRRLRSENCSREHPYVCSKAQAPL